jgi:glycosyltransferase involved in cell wall biosynthesis
MRDSGPDRENELFGRILHDLRIAILIPCYNEECTIASVIQEFQQELPSAKIYVCDNNSSDATGRKAREAGATVLQEKRQGKGYAVQTMFRQIDADIYVMVDGDGTYSSRYVQDLIQPILNDQADMVVGCRLDRESQSDFKPLNRFGNMAFSSILNSTFKVHLSDILSGYRAFSRKFVKGVPLFGGGFEIETELTIKSLERGYRIVEIPVNLSRRISGSYSKLRIIHDGVIILNTILALLRDYKPLTFFGSAGIFFGFFGVVLALVALMYQAAILPSFRLPTMIAAVGLTIGGMLLMIVGLILHTVVRRFQEFEHQLRVTTEDSSRRREEFPSR